MSPEYLSGAVTLKSAIGSSNIGLASIKPFLNANTVAILNAISDESTGWYEPSIKVALIPTTGYPASGPALTHSWIPFSTAGK